MLRCVSNTPCPAHGKITQHPMRAVPRQQPRFSLESSGHWRSPLLKLWLWVVAEVPLEVWTISQGRAAPTAPLISSLSVQAYRPVQLLPWSVTDAKHSFLRAQVPPADPSLCASLCLKIPKFLLRPVQPHQKGAIKSSEVHQDLGVLSIWRPYPHGKSPSCREGKEDTESVSKRSCKSCRLRLSFIWYALSLRCWAQFLRTDSV